MHSASETIDKFVLKVTFQIYLWLNGLFLGFYDFEYLYRLL